MPRSKYRIFETEYPYFMTCTVNGWLPVFTRPETVSIVLDSWRFLAANAHFALYGFVILENHLHLIASAPDLSRSMQRFKRFTARAILKLLAERNAETLLRQFAMNKRNHKVESNYQFWDEGSHPQQIQNDEMMIQKLEYFHQNPVKRGYVDEVIDWRYSSARNYEGQPGMMEVVTDW